MSREWGVKWEAIGSAYPEEIHAKKSREDAAAAVESSAFQGVLVSREVSEWEVES